MASRRRRSRSWSKRLRRSLFEHRFSAAEGCLGIGALGLGLWLLWPAPDGVGIDHRVRWEQSLAAAGAPGEDAEAERGGFDSSFISAAQASVSISAKRNLVGSFGQPSGPMLLPRLARVADTMPEIGPPELAALPSAEELAVRLPEPAPTPDDDGSLDFPIEEGVTLSIGPEDAVPLAKEAAPDERQLAALVVPRPGPSDGVPNWLRHAAVPPVAHKRPMIAVVIDDLGLNRRNTAAINQFEGPLTVAFLPYAGELERQTRAARAAGHELLLHMPMEPMGQDWPGPNALLTSSSPEEFRQRLLDNFDSFPGYVGMNNHMGSRLTADPERMAIVMAELRKRDLLFLDSMTTARSVGTPQARRFGVPSTRRDVFIDTIFSRESREQVERQLALVERIARERGMAVAIGHPHDATIEALRHWLPTLEKRGLALVPLSTIVAKQSCIERQLVVACRAFRDGDSLRTAAHDGPTPPG